MLVTVDTGGTKTLVASFSASGKLETTTKFPTPKQEMIYISMLAQTIDALREDASLDTVVVAIPGIVKNGVAISCGNLPWTNFDITAALRKHYPKARILVENDANLGGLGEVRLLKAPPESVLYTTISTGIGTGIITSGSIDPGVRFSEGGHALVEYDGLVRTWESFASGAAIYKAYGKFGRDITSQKTWRQIADRISRGFLAVIPILQPDLIIIGGSMGTHFSKYDEQLIGILKERLPAYIPCPEIIEARHPEEAVLYGCYFYATDQPT